MSPAQIRHPAKRMQNRQRSEHFNQLLVRDPICRLVQNVPRIRGLRPKRRKQSLATAKRADSVALAQRGTVETILAPRQISIDRELMPKYPRGPNQLTLGLIFSAQRQQHIAPQTALRNLCRGNVQSSVSQVSRGFEVGLRGVLRKALYELAPSSARIRDNFVN